MLKYRLLRQNCALNMWCGRALVGIDPDSLLTGSLIDAPTEPLQIILAEEGGDRTDFIEWPCFAVSSLMREALDNAGVDNIQYFSASVEREGSNIVLEDYWIGNILGLVSCAEMGIPTETQEIEGGNFNEDAFYVNPDSVRGLLLFRIVEHRSLVLAHEDVLSKVTFGRRHHWSDLPKLVRLRWLVCGVNKLTLKSHSVGQVLTCTYENIHGRRRKLNYIAM